MSLPDFVALDFETANAKRSSACAIGMVRYHDGKIEDSYYTLLRPHDSCSEFAGVNIGIHHIKPSDVVHAPTWADVHDTVQGLIADLPIVAHNMSFDWSVLWRIDELYGFKTLQNQRLCTMKMANRLLPTLPKHKLNIVAEYCCPDELFQHHHAGDDAIMCGKIFVALMKEFGVESCVTSGR